MITSDIILEFWLILAQISNQYTSLLVELDTNYQTDRSLDQTGRSLCQAGRSLGQIGRILS